MNHEPVFRAGDVAQGCLTYKKTPPPGTLMQAYAYGPKEGLEGRTFSYGRGTPVRAEDAPDIVRQPHALLPQGYLTHEKRPAPRAFWSWNSVCNRGGGGLIQGYLVH